MTEPEFRNGTWVSLADERKNRDDGPLPETITDNLEAQERMREHTSRATMAVLVATALHSIAVGNMLPTYNTCADGSLREIATICVD